MTAAQPIFNLQCCLVIFDIYVEYTGTAWLNVLKEKFPENHQTNFLELNEIYQNQFKLKCLGLLGFNTTYGLAISID